MPNHRISRLTFVGLFFFILNAHAKVASQLDCKLFIENQTQALGMGVYPRFNEKFRMIEGQKGSYRVEPVHKSGENITTPFHRVSVTSTDTQTWQDITVEEVTAYDPTQIEPVRKSTSMTYKFHQPDCGIEMITKIETKRPGANGSIEEKTSEAAHAYMCQSIRNAQDKYKAYLYTNDSHVNETFTKGSGYGISSLVYGYQSGNAKGNRERLQKLARLCENVPLMKLDPPQQAVDRAPQQRNRNY